MRTPRWCRFATVAVLATLLLSGTGWAGIALEVGPFDFCYDQYEDNFVEVRRGAEINPGDDLGGTGHCAVNFTGSAGSAGDTWLTRYNNSYGSSWFRGWSGICMAADVLINKFNNSKGAGLVALLQTDPGDKGLFALVVNNGNNDRVTLNTIDPNTGKIVQLASGAMGSAIAENAWYKLVFFLEASGYDDSLIAFALVLSHEDPADPNSDIGTIVGLVGFEGTLSGTGLNSSGYVGMAAWTKSAIVNSSITNFAAEDYCSIE